MPIPKSTNIGKVMHFLKKDHPEMKQDQKIAIAMDMKRKAMRERLKRKS